MKVKTHKDRSTQSDYEGGAIDFMSVDPQECFELGQIMNKLVDNGVEVVQGNWGQGVFIRVPLQKRKPLPAELERKENG